MFRYLVLFCVFWRYVSDVLSSSSAVSSSALGLWTALRRSFSCPSSPRRLVLHFACLCTSVGLGICPRGQGRLLMGFHELDRDAWRQPWFGHAFLIFSSRRKQSRGRFQAVEFSVASGSGFLWGWFWAALITRATDLRIIPPDLSIWWNLIHDMKTLSCTLWWRNSELGALSLRAGSDRNSSEATPCEHH